MSDNQNLNEPETVTLQFLKPDTDEVDFSVEITEWEYQLILTEAEKESLTLEEKILSILRESVKDFKRDSNID